MKRLKSMFALVMILALLMSLSGCIVIPRSKYYVFSIDEVQSVQFYDLSNSDSHESGFQATEEPVYTVPREQTEDFLNDFSELEFTSAFVLAPVAIDPIFIYGQWVVRVNFTNGQYSLHTSTEFGQTFDADGNCIDTTHFCCDEEELEKLINKYYTN